LATVYQRNGVFYAKFVNEHGKRTSKNTGMSRKRDAQREAARLETEALDLRRKASDQPRAFASILETAVREANSGDLTLARAEELLRRLRSYANPGFREVSVDEWFGEWIEAQRPHVSESTIRTYADARRRVMEALGNAKSKGPLSDLSSADVRTALGKIGKKVKGATANMDLRAFRRVLEAAHGEGLVTGNVAKPVRALPTTDSTERAPFTTEEVQKLIETAHTDEWRGLILIAAHTGLRMSDVLSLQRSNIEGSDIVIRPVKTKKNRATIRIPMTPPVQSLIGDRKGAFFPKMSLRSTATHSTTFARVMQKAGVPQDVTLPGGIEARRSFHCLRHSFTSWLAEADVPSDVRRKLTGHKSIGVHDLYTHHDESLQRAIKELPDLTSQNNSETKNE
jgi:integrase